MAMARRLVLLSLAVSTSAGLKFTLPFVGREVEVPFLSDDLLKDFEVPEWVPSMPSPPSFLASVLPQPETVSVTVPLANDLPVCCGDHSSVFSQYWFHNIEWDVATGGAGGKGTGGKGTTAAAPVTHVISKPTPGPECKLIHAMQEFVNGDGEATPRLPVVGNIMDALLDLTYLILPSVGHCAKERSITCRPAAASAASKGSKAGSAGGARCVVSAPFSRNTCLLLKTSSPGYGGGGGGGGVEEVEVDASGKSTGAGSKRSKTAESVVMRVAFDVTYIWKIIAGTALMWMGPTLCRQRWFHYFLGFSTGVMVGLAVLSGLMLRQANDMSKSAVPSWVRTPLMFAVPAVFTMGTLGSYAYDTLHVTFGWIFDQCVCFDRLFCADDNHTMLLCTGIIAYIVVFGGGGVIIVKWYGMFLGPIIEGEDVETVGERGETFAGYWLRISVQVAGTLFLLQSSASAIVSVLIATFVWQIERLNFYRLRLHMYLNAWDRKGFNGITNEQYMDNHQQSDLDQHGNPVRIIKDGTYTDLMLAKLREAMASGKTTDFKTCISKDGNKTFTMGSARLDGAQLLDKVDETHAVNMGRWARGSVKHFEEDKASFSAAPARGLCARIFCCCCNCFRSSPAAVVTDE